MGVNASDVPTSCYAYCNQTSESGHQCYKRCEELAHKDGYKLYGYPSSPNTRRALAVLHEKGLSFDPITVNLTTGDQQKPSFLPINPFGQVPVLLDGHLKLIESRAISLYIENVHRSRGTKLLNHKNYKKMGTETMWMYVESFEFDPPASILVWEQTIKPMKGLKADSKVVNETERKLEKVLDVYEERLKNSSFLASNRFTMADLFHLPNIQYLMNTTTKRLFENRPSVHRWVAKITARPAWKKACDANAWYGKRRITEN
ncbi:Glutathione S-transferase F5 [Hirschfeldia incana]|nr:Glutathione S-transferase F5 [Hirschfeldia incana]